VADSGTRLQRQFLNAQLRSNTDHSEMEILLLAAK
jgi:hypothetical protein